MTTSSQRSWLSIVLEADPQFNDEKNVKTASYRFSGGKVFREKPGTFYTQTNTST